MIKTAGLSSLGPGMVELGRVLAAFESAIVVLKILTSEIDRCLQMHVMEMQLKKPRPLLSM